MCFSTYFASHFASSSNLKSECQKVLRSPDIKVIDVRPSVRDRTRHNTGPGQLPGRLHHGFVNLLLPRFCPCTTAKNCQKKQKWRLPMEARALRPEVLSSNLGLANFYPETPAQIARLGREIPIRILTEGIKFYHFLPFLSGPSQFLPNFYQESIYIPGSWPILYANLCKSKPDGATERRNPGSKIDSVTHD